MVKYKIGRLPDGGTHVQPDDEFRLTITETDQFGREHRKVCVNEKIHKKMHVTHYAIFYAPGIGIGGLFGTEELPDEIGSIFCNAVRVAADEDVAA